MNHKPNEWDVRAAAFQSGFMAALTDPTTLTASLTRYLEVAGCPAHLMEPERQEVDTRPGLGPYSTTRDVEHG